MSAAERIRWWGEHPAYLWSLHPNDVLWDEVERLTWQGEHPVLFWSQHPCDEWDEVETQRLAPANDNSRRIVALATDFPEQPNGAATSSHPHLPLARGATASTRQGRGDAFRSGARKSVGRGLTPPTNPNTTTVDAEEPTRQMVLQDEDYIYDVVGNPVEIRDWRDPQDWPAGAKPVTKKIEYDDLYRATRIKYEYAEGDDDWQSPFQAEVEGTADDPRQSDPSPHVEFQKRILEQTFEYDWVGNNEKTGDDADGFYDRSLGDIDNDDEAQKPYQLKGAALAGPSGGSLQARYDAAGNMTKMGLLRSGDCIAASQADAGDRCNQQFVYDWDEVGRLVRARRWDNQLGSVDSFDSTTAGIPAADLRNTYDASDQRVIKEAVDLNSQTTHSYTLYIFESLELRRTVHQAGKAEDGTSADYEISHYTVVPYLLANGVRLARFVYHAQGAVPEEDYDSTGSSGDVDGPLTSSGKLHVFFELGDHLGSTSVVLDKATGELVERSTFQGYGGAESDYRPGRWKSFREDYRFTGKEEDVEVGLQYFGKRFLNPLLGRWISADPLEVHAPGEADLNVYAYVKGSVLRNVDPLGLRETVPGKDGVEGGAGPAPSPSPEAKQRAQEKERAQGEGYKAGREASTAKNYEDVPNAAKEEEAKEAKREECGDACYQAAYDNAYTWGYWVQTISDLLVEMGQAFLEDDTSNRTKAATGSRSNKKMEKSPKAGNTTTAPSGNAETAAKPSTKESSPEQPAEAKVDKPTATEAVPARDPAASDYEEERNRARANELDKRRNARDQAAESKRKNRPDKGKEKRRKKRNRARANGGG